jgi:hypothetical protein
VVVGCKYFLPVPECFFYPERNEGSCSDLLSPFERSVAKLLRSNTSQVSETPLVPTNSDPHGSNQKMPMTRFLILASLAVLISCESKDLGCPNRHDTTCGVSDPVIEIAWVADWKTQADADCDEVCRTSIVRGKYKRQVVFFTFVGGPLCDTFFQAELFNCCGESLKYYDFNDFQEFDAEVTDRTTLYTCTP